MIRRLLVLVALGGVLASCAELETESTPPTPQKAAAVTQASPAPSGPDVSKRVIMQRVDFPQGAPWKVTVKNLTGTRLEFFGQYVLDYSKPEHGLVFTSTTQNAKSMYVLGGYSVLEPKATASVTLPPTSEPCSSGGVLILKDVDGAIADFVQWDARYTTAEDKATALGLWTTGASLGAPTCGLRHLEVVAEGKAGPGNWRFN